jgi:hypothetical protein
VLSALAARNASCRAAVWCGDTIFTMPLLLKDFDLGLGAAHDVEAPMPIAAATAALVASAIGAGHRTEDFAALLVEQARRAGLHVRPENVFVDDGLGGGR